MVGTKQEDKLVSTVGDAVEFDNAVYRDVTIAARLTDIRLIGSHYTIKPDVFEALDDLDNMSFFGEPSGFHFDVETGVMIGHYNWTAEVKYGRKKVLKLVSEYLIAYTGLSGFEEDYVRFYFDKVGASRRILIFGRPSVITFPNLVSCCLHCRR